MKKNYLVCNFCGKEMTDKDEIGKAVQITTDNITNTNNSKIKIPNDNISFTTKVVFNNKIHYINIKDGQLDFCCLSCFNKFFEGLAAGEVSRFSKENGLTINKKRI